MTMDHIEVITSVERRRRWSTAEKARLVAAMDEPGTVVTEVARKAKVCASLQYRCRRELMCACRTPAFASVRVSSGASDEVPATALPCPPPPTQSLSTDEDPAKAAFVRSAWCGSSLRR